MHGRRDLPRARQDARRLQQHQRHDLPARQPARLRALGGRPGHGDVGLRALPAVLQADGELPRRGPRRPVPGHARPAARWSAARRRTRCSGRSSRPSQQAGYPLTDDVNGYRQEGFAPFDRNIHRGRRWSAARAYLHPVMQRPNLEVRTRALRHRVLFDGNRAVGVEYRHGAVRAEQRPRRRGDPVRRRHQLPAAAAAVGRRQRRGAGAARHRRRARPARRRARTCRTTWRSTSSTPARSRCRCSPSLQAGASGRSSALQWLFLRRGPGATNHFEARWVRPQQRRRRVSQPDVPLPADRGPLRRLRARRAITATRCTSGRCTPTRAGRSSIKSHGSARCTRRCASTTCPPSRTAASGSRRSASRGSILSQPAFAPVQRRRDLARPVRSRPTSRSSTGSRSDGETALHPSCTCRDGHRRPTSVVDPLTMRVHGIDGAAGRRCVGRCRTSPTATSTRP